MLAGIVHRDLKLENMVMLDERDDSPVKIADFGLSKFFSPETVLSTMCGSPQYVAPEVLGVGDGLKEYSPAVDMWSVGVILFILLSGYSPFGGWTWKRALGHAAHGHAAQCGGRLHSRHCHTIVLKCGTLLSVRGVKHSARSSGWDGWMCASMPRVLPRSLLLSSHAPLLLRSADDDNDAVLFEKIKKGNYDADDPIWENISPEAKDIVAKLLTVDSAKRLTAEQALAHPWVQGETATTAGSNPNSKPDG